MATSRRSPANVADAINLIADHVNEVLNANQTERYFESLVVLYSLIEDVLRWMVFLKTLWDRSTRELEDDELKEIIQLTGGLTFYDGIHRAKALGIISAHLGRRIDKVRRERNDLLHQAWLYAKRSDGRVMRKKLEKVAHIANDLIGSVNTLTAEIGIDEAFEAFP